jgi:nicotinate-nucleotide pyrophosphorylase (carboxylating)
MNLDDLIREAIREDMGDGDHTSLATIPTDATGRARLLVKEPGVIAGTEIAGKIFGQIDARLNLECYIGDGAWVKPGDVVFEVSGPVRSILAGERLALNFMQRMSGIATATHTMAELLKGSGTRLLDTRKTTPLLRELEKIAVRAGGGYNHRMGLYDMILIKDNHIDFCGSITKAIDAVAEYLLRSGRKLKIEIEVRNFQELGQVMKRGGVDRIMLDNFTPEDLARAVSIIDRKYETEASGGINLDNLAQYARTGVDFISAGALTHHIRSLDLSLKAVP